MERLTKRWGDMVWYDGEHNGRKVYFEPCEVMSDGSATDIRKILAKLAEYEDTGREPEEIVQIMVSLAKYEESGFTSEEVMQMAVAKEEGRLKISPPPITGTCGTCTNFQREPGKCRGTCSIRKYVRGHDNHRPLIVVQSRKACRGDYDPIVKEDAE